MGKIREYDEECFFRKKIFSYFWKPSLQKWEEQNMPLVAGRLLLVSLPTISGFCLFFYRFSAEAYRQGRSRTL